MARSSMFPYNHAQRAKAGDKQGYRKDASPSFKKATSAVNCINKASKALAQPCVPIPAVGTFRIRTCEDLFWALSTVVVAWLVQQGIEASNMDHALETKLSASLCSPTPKECAQQLQQCGEDDSSQGQCQGQQEAAGTKPAAAGSPTLAFVYVEAGCSSRCSSDSAADMALPVEQEPATEQDDTAADAHCIAAGSSQQQLQPAAEQAAAVKGKLQLCAVDSDILQQQEKQMNEPASPSAAVVGGAAAAAAAAAGHPAGVHRPSWLQRTFAKLFSCGSFNMMADV